VVSLLIKSKIMERIIQQVSDGQRVWLEFPFGVLSATGNPENLFYFHPALGNTETISKKEWLSRLFVYWRN